MQLVPFDLHYGADWIGSFEGCAATDSTRSVSQRLQAHFSRVDSQRHLRFASGINQMKRIDLVIFPLKNIELWKLFPIFEAVHAKFIAKHLL